MLSNPLKEITTLGQSIWLDYIKRDLLITDKLQRLIAEDDLRGITSNPSIFEEAIAKSQDYEQQIALLKSVGNDANSIYENLSQHDVGDAADAFRALYNQTATQDGYVSLEVNPYLAHDTQGTLIEARRLWAALARPNVLIKIPATLEGIDAIEQLISEGININVTLLFDVARYEKVANAFLSGLEKRVANGQSIEHLASVASFFISRIDTLIDPLLETIIAQGGEAALSAQALLGQVAIASAKNAYQIYLAIVHSDRFKGLRTHNAQTQRLLWASTSTKNPAYGKGRYIDALIGAETVNTVPLDTLNAYRDCGDPKPRLEENSDQAREVFQKLATLGIDIEKLSQQLEDEGVAKFKLAFDQLLAAIERK